ncbi:tRNA-cytidine(32) 2-sulfurtransferase [Caerostris darwini]|uniref:tRNA-cytidine(32) 2-sulfurtransferase n=1 Tax=Caerostris darwini TaxID=1538125 RepID=A0AAV4QLC9_9ARAC|nr:tRNA-cytidine(32) 2-sulfurtransferase [Caerostris darwini]
MEELNVNYLKDSSNRRFYSLPDDYNDSCKTINETTLESTTLINEIYSNISSRSASFDGPFGWRPVTYCDYAASGQSLNFIEDYLRTHVLPLYGNTHTTITATSRQSTYYRHEAKDIIRKAVNASEHDAIIFAGTGSTSAVSKLIHALNIKLPVVIFVGPFEHHSNLLPWREINAKIVRIKETTNGLVDLHHLEAELKKYYDKEFQLIGSFSAASNITGILTDDKSVSILLHKYGALSFWDYAAAAPYVCIDMNPIMMGQDEGLAYKDAIFISPHKFVGGPDTPGILIAKKKLLQNPIPSEPGGGTIFFVSRSTHRYLKDVEMREEGGTPSIIGAIRAGMAFQLKEAIGHAVIAKRENQICQMTFNAWENIQELHLLGSTSVSRLPIFSFVIRHPQSGLYLHHNFVCALLNDLFGIQTRSGCACAGPYALDLLGINEDLALRFDKLLAENKSLDRTHLRRIGEYSEREVLRPGFIRLTLPFFMPDDDINFVLKAVALVAKNGWKLLPQYSFNPETGEWKHIKRQIFLSRKWLGSISYKTGHFSVKEDCTGDVTIMNSKDLLEESEKLFQTSAVESAKKFTPDQQLIFDADSSDLRWFLLPSEAKQYILGENVSRRKSVFIARSSCNMDLLNQNEENNLAQSSIQNPAQDMNCNVIESTGVSLDGIISSQRQISEYCNLSCPVINENKLALHRDILANAGKCKWHPPPTIIFKPFLKAVSQFNMIQTGDKVLVCISGGKDSLSLLHTLRQYQFYAKNQGIHFEIGAMTVDPKSPLYDPSPLKDYLKALNTPYFYEEQDIVGQAANLEKCTSICSFCSRLKRGRIYACAHRQNYNVIALGQHLDDIAESFLMSAFHNGRLRTMKAHYTDKSSSLRIIRPFVFVREKDLRTFAEQKKLPVIPENCPACFEAPKERHRMKQLLAAQEVQFPKLYRSLRTALLPLMAINLTGVENKILGKGALQNFEALKLEEDDD